MTGRRLKPTILIVFIFITAMIIPGLGVTFPASARTAEQPVVEGDGVHYLGRRPASSLEAMLLREITPETPTPRLKGRLLPSSVNLSSELPPVGDQGIQGSCVSWACTYYQKTHSEKKFEHTSWDLTNPWYRFSPAFTYNQGGGSLPQYEYPILEEKGCVDIAEFPYDESDDTTQPTAAQLEAAKPYRIDGDYSAVWNHLGDTPPYSTPNPIDDAKALLADGYVLSSGIYVGSSFPDYGATPPAMYYDPGTGSTANHQVCICGYDDQINPGGSGPDHQGGFLMVNSWGTGWNGVMNGYLWISYDWMKYYVEDCWVIHDVGPDTPSISDLSTNSANVGEPVTITGNNFGTNRRSAEVSFNGTTATTTVFTNDSIATTVPAGATSGPLTVYDWEGTPSNQVEFYVGGAPPLPALSDIFPDSGKAGDTVTINGTNFGITEGTVDFNGTEATEMTTWSDTRIELKVPAGATTGDVTVTNAVGTSNGVTFTVNMNPGITSLYPDSGYVGDTVTVNGNYFGATRGTSTVRFGDTICTDSDYVSWADNRVEVKVPSGAQGNIQVTVTTAGGTSNGGSFTVNEPEPPEPEGKHTWYLAEGTTDWGFSTYISIENPNGTSVNVRITYMTPEGPVPGGEANIPAMSQATVNPVDALGQKDFSTLVECTDKKTIAVDRTMIWTGPGASSPESHNSIGVTSPATTWFLPEGSSKWGFETWLLIQNPCDTEATCHVTYMPEGKGPLTFEKKIPPNSRQSYDMASDIGREDASIMVESDVPVIPERAMYRDNRREGHDSVGTTTPASSCYLAEGTTAWGFTTYILVQNPNNTDTSVTLTYMTPSGAQPQAPVNLAANSRRTIRVNDFLPNSDFSTRVNGSQPIVAERAMYWNSGTGEACHDSIGMDSAHTTFYLPDGQTSNGRETWTLVQNPNDSAITVEISYLTSSGTGNVVFRDTIGSNSRRTYSMADSGIPDRAAVMVRSLDSNKKIMCERSMYWNSRGAGTGTIGGYED